MARPRLQEINYFEFKAALANAADNGQRIEPTEKDRWKAWVSEHDVREAAFKSFGDNVYDDLRPVIITSEDEWKGYYLYSTVDEGCLRWER
ncbi:MAG: hypothetical protein AAGG11_19565 [Pseudomonadota bacterium]